MHKTIHNPAKLNTLKDGTLPSTDSYRWIKKRSTWKTKTKSRIHRAQIFKMSTHKPFPQLSGRSIAKRVRRLGHNRKYFKVTVWHKYMHAMFNSEPTSLSWHSSGTLWLNKCQMCKNTSQYFLYISWKNNKKPKTIWTRILKLELFR